MSPIFIMFVCLVCWFSLFFSFLSLSASSFRPELKIRNAIWLKTQSHQVFSEIYCWIRGHSERHHYGNITLIRSECSYNKNHNKICEEDNNNNGNSKNNNSVQYSKICALTIIIRRVRECFSSFRIYVRHTNLRIVYECISVRVSLIRISQSWDVPYKCVALSRCRLATSNFWLMSSTLNVPNGSRTFPILKL